MLALAAVSDDDDDDDDDDAASAAGGGVSLTSLLAADGDCADPDADDVLSIVHDIHQHLNGFIRFVDV